MTKAEEDRIARLLARIDALEQRNRELCRALERADGVLEALSAALMQAGVATYEPERHAHH